MYVCAFLFFVYSHERRCRRLALSLFCGRISYLMHGIFVLVVTPAAADTAVAAAIFSFGLLKSCFLFFFFLGPPFFFRCTYACLRIALSGTVATRKIRI